MKLISFERGGRAGWGAVTSDAVADLSVRHPEWPTLRAALAGGLLDRLPTPAADFPLTEATLLPPVPDAGRIICIGLNYRTHIAEMGRDMPEHPTLFTRFPDSLVGHGAPMIRPRVSDKFDYEGELAVVIGRPGRHIAREAALGHVAGYSCFNDGSVRDWQRHSQQFTAGKNFFHSGAMGPWIVTADELPDPAAATLTTRLNGAVMQHAALSDLLFDVPALIAYISTILPLQPGDVIATGTTGGVGTARTPPVYMAIGDEVEVEISGIGTLANAIEDEA